MTDREWQRERRIDIAMLAVGLVGILLVGSLLLIPFIALAGSGFLLVRLDLRWKRRHREQSEKPPKELSLYEWIKEQQAADKDP